MDDHFGGHLYLTEFSLSLSYHQVAQDVGPWCMERCASGLNSSPGKTVYRKVPRVRIPPSPPLCSFVLILYYKVVIKQIKSFILDIVGYRRPEGIRGFLLIYVIGLGGLFFHQLELTVASVIFYFDPSLIGMVSFIPLYALIFYVITNLIDLTYILILFVLFAKKRRSAIKNTIVYSIISILTLISWHFLGEKSSFGTMLDALPAVVGIFYFLISKRVKKTFIVE